MKTQTNRFRRTLSCFLNLPALLCLALVSAILISCTTTQRAPLTLAAPPQIPGATFVGNKACAECHEKIHGDFPGSAHGRFYRDNDVHWAAVAGCESCHGAGSKHIETGLAADIVNPRHDPLACLKCHISTHGEFTMPQHHRNLEGLITWIFCPSQPDKDNHQPPVGTPPQHRHARCHKRQ